jgi:hypothetical protein
LSRLKGNLLNTAQHKEFGTSIKYNEVGSSRLYPPNQLINGWFLNYKTYTDEIFLLNHAPKMKTSQYSTKELERKALNISEEANHILQFLDTNHPFIFSHFLNTNRETKQMVINIYPQINDSSRSVPELLDPITLYRPAPREAYLIRTNHMKPNKPQGKYYEARSYQFKQCTNKGFIRYNMKQTTQNYPKEVFRANQFLKNKYIQNSEEVNQ